MLYLIGTGLNEKGISQEGLEAIKKCKSGNIYLESYTVEFPYSFDKLEKVIGKRIIVLDREKVENEDLIKKAKRENICLLVYGCPLFATTHISLLLDAKKLGAKIKIIYSASIFDAIAETGLELYKFGKISSMPKWQEHFTPESFLDYVKENQAIGAHSLILIDIGLEFKNALGELEKTSKNKNLKIDKIIVCSNMGGEKSKICYGKISNLKKEKIKTPFCFIIPDKMHFVEQDSINIHKI